MLKSKVFGISMIAVFLALSSGTRTVSAEETAAEETVYQEEEEEILIPAEESQIDEYEVTFAGEVTDAGEYVSSMTIDFGDKKISGLEKDTFEVYMTSTVDYGSAKGQPYAYYDASKPLPIVKTEISGGKGKVYFDLTTAPVLTWLAEGRNYPAILSFRIEQKKPMTATGKDGKDRDYEALYHSNASSWKDLANDELAKFKDVKDVINYQFHKGTNDKLIVFFHGNGEGDFPTKATNNNAAQILANRGGAAWVSEEAQAVFGDASVMAFQAPDMWYYAVNKDLLTPCYNEIQKVISANGINPKEVYLSGASAGGFMSTRMIIAYPDLFKAAMISCPALDAANERSGSDDAIPTDEELAQLLNSDTAIWLVQGETDSSVDPEECSRRIWNILTKDKQISERTYNGTLGIASGFTTYETDDNKYKLSLYKTYDLAEVTGISGKVRQGGKIKCAEDYDQDGVYIEVKYNDHWSWIYTLRNNPEAADGTHIWNWAVNYVEEKVKRISGKSRFDTSIKNAEELKSLLNVDKFENVVLTSGLEFADALAGSYLAFVKNAPVLITAESFGNDIPYKQINAYISANLKAGGTVYVLGGTKAVSEKSLKGLEGFTVHRLSGSSRYETNIEILKEAGVGDRDILISTGSNYADSLSASALKKPILLVGSELNDTQISFLKGLKNKQYYILGGAGAVSEDIKKAISSYGKTKRISGKTRYETSAALASEFCKGAKNAVLAYSLNFPDGLAGGPLAAAINAPIVLTKTGEETAAINYCKTNGIDHGYILGGTGLISDESAVKIFSLESTKQIAVMK